MLEDAWGFPGWSDYDTNQSGIELVSMLIIHAK